MKKSPEFTEAVLGWLILFALGLLAALGVIGWSWWLLVIPVSAAWMGRVSVLYSPLFLTPFGTVATNVSGRNFVSYYVFGIRIIKLHMDR